MRPDLKYEELVEYRNVSSIKGNLEATSRRALEEAEGSTAKQAIKNRSKKTESSKYANQHWQPKDAARSIFNLSIGISMSLQCAETSMCVQ